MKKLSILGMMLGVSFGMLGGASSSFAMSLCNSAQTSSCNCGANTRCVVTANYDRACQQTGVSHPTLSACPGVRAVTNNVLSPVSSGSSGTTSSATKNPSIIPAPAPLLKK